MITLLCLVVTHLCQYGVYLRFLGSTNTIPHRETVAGEACCRSPTCDGDIWFIVDGFEKMACWLWPSGKPQRVEHSDSVNGSVLHLQEWGVCCHPLLSSYSPPRERLRPHRTGCTCELKFMYYCRPPCSFVTRGMFFCNVFIYLLSCLSVGLLMSRKMLDKIPSVQSRVSGSKTPYSSITLMALGLSGNILVCNPSLEKQNYCPHRIRKMIKVQ